MNEIDLDQDPFGEEFELDDVINKSELNSDVSKKGLESAVRKDPEFDTKSFSQDDIDQLVNYDQERRKKLSFESKLNEEIQFDPNDKKDLENTFKDYIVYPRISGNSNLKGGETIIRESQLKRTSRTVEIVDAPKVKEHSPATVVVNRDDRGDIDNIEVVCECGDRILLKFEKADLLDLEKLKLETERLTTPVPFSLENAKEEIKVKKEQKESKTNPFGDDDDFFNVDGEDNSSKSKKIEEEEEEFFDEDFGGDISTDGLDIDLSGIL